jgi:hypothetical protein
MIITIIIQVIQIVLLGGMELLKVVVEDGHVMCKLKIMEEILGI